MFWERSASVFYSSLQRLMQAHERRGETQGRTATWFTGSGLSHHRRNGEFTEPTGRPRLQLLWVGRLPQFPRQLDQGG
jgi:hypothetical protein